MIVGGFSSAPCFMHVVANLSLSDEYLSGLISMGVVMCSALSFRISTLKL